MPARSSPRFALALLLCWQLNAALAVAVPYAATASAALATQDVHCTQQRHTSSDRADVPSGAPAPPLNPDCCHHGSASCQCAQMAALGVPIVALGEPLPPDPPVVAAAESRIDARGTDFFRPPI